MDRVERKLYKRQVISTAPFEAGLKGDIYGVPRAAAEADGRANPPLGGKRGANAALTSIPPIHPAFTRGHFKSLAQVAREAFLAFCSAGARSGALYVPTPCCLSPYITINGRSITGSQSAFEKRDQSMRSRAGLDIAATQGIVDNWSRFLVRFGNAPKRAISLRTDQPLKK